MHPRILARRLRPIAGAAADVCTRIALGTLAHPGLRYDRSDTIREPERCEWATPTRTGHVPDDQAMRPYVVVTGRDPRTVQIPW
jgi:hypothetical protein